MCPSKLELVFDVFRYPVTNSQDWCGFYKKTQLCFLTLHKYQDATPHLVRGDLLDAPLDFKMRVNPLSHHDWCGLYSRRFTCLDLLVSHVDQVFEGVLVRFRRCQVLFSTILCRWHLYRLTWNHSVWKCVSCELIDLMVPLLYTGFCPRTSFLF